MRPRCLTCDSGLLLYYLILISFLFSSQKPAHICSHYQSAVPTTAACAPCESSLARQETFDQKDLECFWARTTEERVAALDYY